MNVLQLLLQLALFSVQGEQFVFYKGLDLEYLVLGGDCDLVVRWALVGWWQVWEFLCWGDWRDLSGGGYCLLHFEWRVAAVALPV
jgi:hypothetical protein